MDALGGGYDDPRTQGLLTLGLQLLASRQPRFGQALGEAGMSAMQAYQGARQGQQQRRSIELQQQAQQMQLEQLQRAAEERRRAQEFAATLPSPEMVASQQALSAGGGPAAANAARMPAVDPRLAVLRQAAQAGVASPMDYINAAFPVAKEEAPLVLAEGARAFRGGREIAANPKQPDLPSTVREFQFGQENPAFNPWLTSRQQAGSTRVNVPVNTERTYAGAVADAIAKQDTDSIDAARSAPERVRVARQVKQILQNDKPITGTLAEQRLAISKALATAGIIDGGEAAATEALASTLASQALAAIKTSGLGAGSGFSNADRDFLERASAGKIDMTAGALARIADLNERAAIRSIERGNKVIERLRTNPSLGSVAGALEPVEVPTIQRMPTAAEIEAEKRRRGIN